MAAGQLSPSALAPPEGLETLLVLHLSSFRPPRPSGSQPCPCARPAPHLCPWTPECGVAQAPSTVALLGGYGLRSSPSRARWCPPVQGSWSCPSVLQGPVPRPLVLAPLQCLSFHCPVPGDGRDFQGPHSHRCLESPRPGPPAPACWAGVWGQVPCWGALALCRQAGCGGREVVRLLFWKYACPKIARLLKITQEAFV